MSVRDPEHCACPAGAMCVGMRGCARESIIFHVRVCTLHGKLNYMCVPWGFDCGKTSSLTHFVPQKPEICRFSAFIGVHEGYPFTSDADIHFPVSDFPRSSTPNQQQESGTERAKKEKNLRFVVRGEELSHTERVDVIERVYFGASLS